jgi:hypothetical protein
MKAPQPSRRGPVLFCKHALMLRLFKRKFCGAVGGDPDILGCACRCAVGLLERDEDKSQHLNVGRDLHAADGAALRHGDHLRQDRLVVRGVGHADVRDTGVGPMLSLVEVLVPPPDMLVDLVLGDALVRVAGAQLVRAAVLGRLCDLLHQRGNGGRGRVASGEHHRAGEENQLNDRLFHHVSSLESGGFPTRSN